MCHLPFSFALLKVSYVYTSYAWNRDVWSNFTYQKIIILFMEKRASSCLLPSKATLHLLHLMQLDMFFHRMSASPFMSHAPSSYSFSRNASWLAPFNTDHRILGCLQSLWFYQYSNKDKVYFTMTTLILKKLLGDDLFFRVLLATTNHKLKFF